MEQGGRGVRSPPPRPHLLVPKTLLPNVFDNTIKTDFGEHIFCPQTTQVLPKKHHEAGLPEQLPTDALSQIDYGQTRYCKVVKMTSELEH